MAYQIDSITANTVDSKVITSETMGLNSLTAETMELNSLTAQTIESDSIILSGTPITPPSYKVYSALLNQTGTNAPVATVLENTIGNIVWSRVSPGGYNGTLNGAFVNNKTFVILSGLGQPILFGFRLDDNNIQIQTTDTTYGNLEWNSSFPQSIEIRVYN